MTFEVRRVIAGDHPSVAGHFPGHPVVPGALILEEVMEAARQWCGPIRLTRIVSVKFSSPLLPGNAFVIALHEEDSSCISFECFTEGSTLAYGKIAIVRCADES